MEYMLGDVLEGVRLFWKTYTEFLDLVGLYL